MESIEEETRDKIQALVKLARENVKVSTVNEKSRQWKVVVGAEWDTDHYYFVEHHNAKFTVFLSNKHTASGDQYREAAEAAKVYGVCIMELSKSLDT